MCFQPDHMTISLAGLRPTRLPHIGARTAAAERNEFANLEPRRVSNAHNHLEITLDVTYFPRLLHQLNVATGIGKRPRFFVSIRRRKNHISHLCGLGEKHVLHYDKSI